MSDTSDSDENLPTAAECDARCKEFAEVTGTDTALAMFYLQDRNWDVQRSLDAFFEENASASPPSRQPSSTTSSMSSQEVDPEPHRIRVVSYNIDGLDKNNTVTRCKEACKVILKENPDVVFLQEVVSSTLPVIEETCTNYFAIPGDTFGYFSTMLLKVQTVIYKKHSVIEFGTSSMGRNLLKVEAVIKGIPCLLMTSHLESTSECAEERKRQLRKALHTVTTAPGTQTVIFGGDLNLRDKEVAQIGGLPDGVLDLWEVTGKRPEAKYTWDMTRNDNLDFSAAKFKPKSRFDRLYLRHSNSVKIKPVYFELIGLERMSSCKRFPSDHWGILVHFDKT